MLRHIRKSTIALTLVAIGCLITASRGQGVPVHDSKSTSPDSQEAARRKILDSDRWQQANRALNQWLSVQQLYQSEEVDGIKAEMAARTAHMSPAELETMLKDMEERTKVLLSPEAEDARMWLKQFLAVARNPEQQLGRQLPDVLNMTPAQIRQEIRWLEQHRENRAQSQAAFDRTRNIQGQMARDAQAAQQTARAPISNRGNWPANTPRPVSRYSQRREPQPPRPSSLYMSGPWGTPYFRFGG